jgi:hypothetical protein
MARAGALLATALLLLTAAAAASAGTIPVPSGLACPAQIASTDSPYNLLTGFVQTASDDGSIGSTGCRYVAADGHALGELAISWAHGKGVTFSGTCTAAKDTTSTSVIGNNGSTASKNAQVTGSFSEGSLPGLQPFLTATKTLVTAAESLAQPCTTATTPVVATKVSDLPEYAVFLGLNDAATAQAACVERRQQRADDLVSRAASFVGVSNKATIPGETSFGRHSINILWPGNDLYNLLGPSNEPAGLARGGNVYARATASYQEPLRAAILGSEGNLQPADVLYYALKVTNGSYPLAVLTAHNLLKEVGIQGRDVVNSTYGTKGPAPSAIANLQQSAALVGKLASLRCTPGKSHDKIGPWYHEFAALSAGALVTPATARLVVYGEHLGKATTTAINQLRSKLPASVQQALKTYGPEAFFKGEGGFDSEKFALDKIAAGAAGTMAITKLSR